MIAAARAGLLARLHERAMRGRGPHWSAVALCDMMAQPGCDIVVDSETQGFALTRSVAGEAELLALAVAPEARKCGRGAHLLARAIGVVAQRGARELFLEVARTNADAIRLYEKFGFSKVGARPGYYLIDGVRCDAEIYVLRELPGGAGRGRIPSD